MKLRRLTPSHSPCTTSSRLLYLRTPRPTPSPVASMIRIFRRQPLGAESIGTGLHRHCSKACEEAVGVRLNTGRGKQRRACELTPPLVGRSCGATTHLPEIRRGDVGARKEPPKPAVRVQTGPRGNPLNLSPMCPICTVTYVPGSSHGAVADGKYAPKGSRRAVADGRYREYFVSGSNVQRGYRE